MSGKIYTIMSLVPQNGGKYVTTNLGFYTDRYIKKSKVLLIDLDFETPKLASHYTEGSAYDIDDLVPYRDNIDKKIIMEKITKTRAGFDVLRGTNMKEGYISPDVIAKILILAREMYTHVFVTASPDLANSNIVMSVLNSDKLILVLRNNYANDMRISGFINSLDPYLNDDIEVDILFNYRDYNHTLKITKEIRFKDDKEFNYLGFLEYDGKTVDNTNIGERSIFKRGNINKRLFKKICKKHL